LGVSEKSVGKVNIEYLHVPVGEVIPIFNCESFKDVDLNTAASRIMLNKI